MWCAQCYAPFDRAWAPAMALAYDAPAAAGRMVSRRAFVLTLAATAVGALAMLASYRLSRSELNEATYIRYAAVLTMAVYAIVGVLVVTQITPKVRLRWAVSKKLATEELERLRGIPGVRWAGHVAFRPGLRHEAASALAMWRKYRDGTASYPALAVYLAAAHHGKVRTVFRSITDTGDDVFGVPRDPGAIHPDGSAWPLDFSAAKDGAEGQWEHDGFTLTGAGWTGLVSDLLGPWRADDSSHSAVVPDSEPRRLGPFVLAYLEALVRAADWRASDKPSQSIKPEEIAREHKPA